jgi:hypothetical protein
MNSLLIILTCASLLVSCSKSSPNVHVQEVKIDPVVVEDTYLADEALSDITSAKNDQEIERTLSLIRNERDPQFNWTKFWMSTSIAVPLGKLTLAQANNLISLSFNSCNEQPSSSSPLMNYVLNEVKNRLNTKEMSDLPAHVGNLQVVFNSLLKSSQ